VLIGGVDVHTCGEQRLCRAGIALARRIERGSLVHAVRRLRASPRGQEPPDQVRIAVVACGHQRRDPFEGRQVHVRTGRDEAGRERVVALLTGQQQRRLAETVAGIDRCALLQQPLRLGRIALPRCHQQLRVEAERTCRLRLCLQRSERRQEDRGRRQEDCDRLQEHSQRVIAEPPVSAAHPARRSWDLGGSPAHRCSSGLLQCTQPIVPNYRPGPQECCVQ
jgi:hypothetical protein